MRHSLVDAGRALSCLCIARTHSARRLRAGETMMDGPAMQVSDDARPRLPRGVRLAHNEAQGGWVLLAPVRVFKGDDVIVEILKRCTGEATLAAIVGVIAAALR